MRQSLSGPGLDPESRGPSDFSLALMRHTEAHTTKPLSALPTRGLLMLCADIDRRQPREGALVSTLYSTGPHSSLSHCNKTRPINPVGSIRERICFRKCRTRFTTSAQISSSALPSSPYAAWT